MRLPSGLVAILNLILDTSFCPMLKIWMNMKIQMELLLSHVAALHRTTHENMKNAGEYRRAMARRRQACPVGDAAGGTSRGIIRTALL
jgi:hypothetical protein